MDANNSSEDWGWIMIEASSPLKVRPAFQHPNLFERRHGCLEPTGHSGFVRIDDTASTRDPDDSEGAKGSRDLPRIHQQNPSGDIRSRRHIFCKRTRPDGCHSDVPTVANDIVLLSDCGVALVTLGRNLKYI